MIKEDIASILANYTFNSFENFEFQAFGAGLIHGTYLIESGDAKFILQEFNNGVFQFPERISHNQRLIKSQGNDTFLPFQLPLPILNSNNKLITTVHGRLFRLFEFVSGQTIQEISGLDQAYLAAKAYGVFAEWGKDVDTSQLQECIPNFHRFDLRFAKLEEVAAEKNSLSKEDQEILDFYLGQKKLIESYQEFKAILPQRLTHNDTKISNALFSKNNKGLCVIDTDTIMPGIVHYDFGDAIRTICNTAAEDETNLNLVEFNVSYYKAYTKGFLEKMEASLTPLELKHLPLGAKTMIFIMAIRFLTDYMNNDVYYKTKYSEHNLDRAKNQFKLLESLTQQLSKIENYYE